MLGSRTSPATVPGRGWHTVTAVAFLPLFISLAALVIYAATLSQHHSADSLIYALQIEAGDWAAMVDPSHLLLHPLGWAWGEAGHAEDYPLFELAPRAP